MEPLTSMLSERYLSNGLSWGTVGKSGRSNLTQFLTSKNEKYLADHDKEDKVNSGGEVTSSKNTFPIF